MYAITWLYDSGHISRITHTTMARSQRLLLPSLFLHITPSFGVFFLGQPVNKVVIHESPETLTDAGNKCAFSGLPLKASVGEIGGITAGCVMVIAFGVPGADI